MGPEAEPRLWLRLACRQTSYLNNARQLRPGIPIPAELPEAEPRGAGFGVGGVVVEAAMSSPPMVPLSVHGSGLNRRTHLQRGL